MSRTTTEKDWMRKLCYSVYTCNLTFFLNYQAVFGHMTNTHITIVNVMQPPLTIQAGNSHLIQGINVCCLSKITWFSMFVSAYCADTTQHRMFLSDLIKIYNRLNMFFHSSNKCCCLQSNISVPGLTPVGTTCKWFIIILLVFCSTTFLSWPQQIKEN